MCIYLLLLMTIIGTVVGYFSRTVYNLILTFRTDRGFRSYNIHRLENFKEFGVPSLSYDRCLLPESGRRPAAIPTSRYSGRSNRFQTNAAIFLIVFPKTIKWIRRVDRSVFACREPRRAGNARPERGKRGRLVAYKKNHVGRHIRTTAPWPIGDDDT